jgi:hypothetical protein
MPIGDRLSSLNKSFMSDSNRYKKIMINEIPFMYGIHGEIVCIPKTDEVFAAAIVGASGTGKSVLLNSLVSRMHYQWKVNISIMNDVSEETYKWDEPAPVREVVTVWDNPRFVHICQLNKKINQPPCPSPLVYLFPSSNTLKIPEKFKKRYVKISLPFRDIFENIGYFLKGVSPDFILGKSELYVKDIPELSNVTSVGELREMLDEKLPGKEGKNFQAMRIKIMTAFGALMKEQILNITNPECPAYLRVGDYFGNPFTAIMKAGAIPSFITSDLINKNYKSEIFAYYIEELFKNNHKDFPNQKTFLVFDELKDVCVRDDEPASHAIGLIASRGRINNVGLIYCTQFYDKIPHSVRGAKLNYCFCFQHKNAEILREIGSDFDLTTDERKKILNLKQFEIIALTNNRFICYKDGVKYEVKTPIRGTLLGPLANHKKAAT